MSKKILLCQIAELEDVATKKVAHPLQKNLDLVLIKNQQDYYAYHNICPHFSVQLDNAKGQFFTYNQRWIMCAHHSAMFEIETGLCVDGPCKSRQLTAEPIVLENGGIYLQNCSEIVNS
ncbi:Rieske (2Fe-2S) protein [Acinetobacter indicus]|uniref:Rieske 2Fe-2S domain-containing protein n=1 Tax=Acinetobacter indicus TaxID=756892 RepID=A0A6C0Y030_9GAMM|nr:Rieske 2Fe-2S domain-containing protein [Acinetobacter indicus]QIC69499.1 Rieske 2Fe-2S domain-containing protein [Acinetobacter indicus]